MTSVNFSQIQTILGSSVDDPAWKKLQTELQLSQHSASSTRSILTFQSSYLWFDYSIIDKQFVSCGIDAKKRKLNDPLLIVLPNSAILGESRQMVQEKLGKPQWTGSYKNVKVDSWTDTEAEMLPLKIEWAPNLLQDLYIFESVATYMRFDGSAKLESVLFSRLNGFDEVRIMQGKGKTKEAALLLVQLLHQRINSDNLLIQNDCYELAKAFELANDYDCAEEYYKKAISLSKLPIAGFIRKGYSEMLLLQGKINEGLEQLKLWCLDSSTPSQLRAQIEKRMLEVQKERSAE